VGGNWSSFNVNFSSSPILFNSSETGGDGEYEFRILATDNAGNMEIPLLVGSGFEKVSTFVDTVNPTTTDDAPSGWQNMNVTITLMPNDTEPSSGLEFTRFCRGIDNDCDSEDGTDYVGPVEIMDENITFFEYSSKDNAGNMQTVNRTIMIDKTAPTSSVDELSEFQNTAIFEINYTADDGDLSGVAFVELFYRKDGGGWVLFEEGGFESSPISFDSSVDGDGYYEFKSVV